MKRLKYPIFIVMLLLSSVFFPICMKAQDTSWYSDSETVFTLTTADQLIGLRTLINNGKKFDGKTIKLGNDIDVSSTNWTAISSFKGTFDGCGHTITYSYSYDKNSCPTSNGLFGYTSNATIKNLRVSGSLYVQSKYNNYTIYCGGIVGKGTNTSIINCCNNVQIEYDRYSFHPDKSYYNYNDYVGGICGYSDGSKISYCVNEALIKCPLMYAYVNTGGICGYAYSTTEITKCENTNSVLGFTTDVSGYMAGCTYQGGIVGRVIESSYITYCRNTGNCIANNSGSVYLGGIAGEGNCKSCYVASEKITSNRTPKAITSYGTINNCFANNNIVGVSISGSGVNFDYSLSQMKTVDFVSALNETTYMWVGGEGVLPVVLGSMNETEDYTTRPNPGTIVLNMNDIDIPLESELQLTATVLPEGAWQTVVWESSNPEIVSVTDNGLLTGNAVGNAKIIVTSTKDNSITATCNVHVGTREVKQIILPECINVHYAEERQLDITILPSYADMNLVYESANENVATIDEGKIVGVGVGETIITVKDLLTGVQTNCNVNVYLEVGDTFDADVSNGNGTVSTKFVITDVENRYVSIGNGTNTAIATTAAGNIVIPQTIIGSSNINFTVNSISSKAFASSKISSVSIPQEITAIGDNAFYGCNNLTSVTVEWPEPLAINSTCFSNASNATLNVPKDCYEAYTEAENWCNFKSIVEPAHTNGDSFIASITAGGEATDAVFVVIDAEKKYASVGNGEEPAIADYTSGLVVVPSTVKGYDGRTYQVKQISDAAFFDCYELTSIGLPSGITAIGRASFYDCAGLTSFTIPSTVTSLGDEAFTSCYNLTSINIPASVTSIGEAAFYGCSKLNSVTVNWSEPIAIDNECFTNAKNATLNVPKGSYESYASAENWKNFKTIKEPAHVVGDTFVGYVMVDGVKTNARYKVTNATNKYVNIGNGEECAISDFTSGNVVVPSSVTGYDGQIYQVKQVASAAFFGCTEVTSIEVPSGITSFGQAAFYQCSAITSFDIPTTVTTIGEGTFSYCENLQEILIPKNVKSIGTNAFAECENLTLVTVEWTTPITINEDCFSNAANATLFVPCETKELYGSANGWKMFKEIVELYKDGDVFKELIEGGVEMTFKVISAADKTCQVGTGKDSGTAISMETTGTITIPQTINGLTVKEISDYAFYNCTGITDIDIPNSVTTIGMNALRNCSSLTGIIIPNSINSLGLGALANNKNLESIVVESGNTTYDSRDNCNAIICTATNELISGCKETTIPNSVTSIGRSAFNGCYNLSGITIPNSITTIGQYAFYTCSSLTDVYIPNSVTSIGQYAFEKCSSLTDVYISNSVTSIEQYAFKDCNNLTSVTVEWDDPISIGTNCFSNAANAVLCVPIGTNYDYSIATGWKLFGKIVNTTESSLFATDIEEIPLNGINSLSIKLSNKETVAGCSFTLNLPAGMTIQKDKKGNPVYNINDNRISSDEFVIIPKDYGDGTYQFRVMPTGNALINGTEGELFSVKVYLDESVTTGEYDVLVTDSKLTNGDLKSLALLDSSSKIRVSQFEAGDVNNDHSVDLTDAIIIVYNSFPDAPPGVKKLYADVNGDGTIDLTDAIIVVYKSFPEESNSRPHTSIFPD